jgi:hypothetical protein
MPKSLPRAPGTTAPSRNDGLCRTPHHIARTQGSHQVVPTTGHPTTVQMGEGSSPAPGTHAYLEGADTAAWLHELGHCLMFLQNNSAAYYSFQQEVTRNKEDGGAVHNVSCNKCSKSGFMGVRYVCRTCPDTDLCGSCMDLYTREGGSKTCHNHQFLDVSLLPPHSDGNVTTDAIPSIVQEWLKKLLITYGETTSPVT